MREQANEQLLAATSDIDPVIVGGFALDLAKCPHKREALLAFSLALKTPNILEIHLKLLSLAQAMEPKL